MKAGQDNRRLMKSSFGLEGFEVSDQSRGVPPPPMEKPCASNARRVELPKARGDILKNHDLFACLARRRSRREFTRAALTLDELALLLWATQGVQEVDPGGAYSLRTTPSAGARHPFETYVVANRVTGLDTGVYRYLPLAHRLVFEFSEPDFAPKLSAAAFGQGFVGDGAAVFVWSCLPYRGEWRYVSRAHKVMLFDAGHLCENLYLACEGLGLATCAIGAYDQAAMDALFRLDGAEEFVVYLAPVGR